MIVIIDGPDGSGKSTLAEKICQLTGAELIHASEPQRHPLVEYTYQILPSEDYVLDRWHLGELVYGPLYRGGSGLSDAQFDAVEEYLDDLGAIVVHCTGPVMELMTRLRQRGEQPHASALRREARAFDDAMRRTRLPVFTSPVGMELRADEAIAYARDREARCAVGR